mgnify:CR=1 FL=1
MQNKDDELPFSYYSPESGGYVIWNCGTDKHNKITSIFEYRKPGYETDRIIDYLSSLESAIFHRDELIKNGWKKVIKPTIQIHYSNSIPKKMKDYLNGAK